MQRCWVHKTANILNELPKSVQGKAKAGLHEIWMALARAEAIKAFDAFLSTNQPKWPKATVVKDREALLAFYDFPAEHWIPCGPPTRSSRPSPPCVSASRTKNCVSSATFLGLALKLVQEAQESWRRIRGIERIGELLAGILQGWGSGA